METALVPASPTALQKLDDESKEAISMLTDYDDEDITVGRASHGLDPSEYDALPTQEANFLPEDAAYIAGLAKPQPFRAPVEHFPILKSALRRFQAESAHPRTLRVDTESTFLGFACDQAVRELDRRITELRTMMEEHVADEHGAPIHPMRRWDVIGASEAITDLREATSAKEAVEKLDQVPLDLPEFARGKVSCWRDGNSIVCSIRFLASDGTGRIATMSARPSLDVDEVAGAILASGCDPVAVLGALPDVTAIAAGKRLVREVAGAALQARKREEVVGMTGEAPVVLARGGETHAPLAAVMYLQQRAERGDAAAQTELAKLHAAAQSPNGQKIAAPVLQEAHRRLHAGRPKKGIGTWFKEKLALLTE